MIFGVLLASLSPPAGASPDSAACRAECAAPFAERSQNSLSAQSCLARCRVRTASADAVNTRAATPPRPQDRRVRSSSTALQQAPGRSEDAPALPASAPARYGAIYLAPAPSRAYGLAVGVPERDRAHREAETACLRGNGGACRPGGSFTARCGAVVHTLRAKGAVITSHPSTYTVVAANGGSGETRTEAEREALSACGSLARGALCAVTEARCAD